MARQGSVEHFRAGISSAELRRCWAKWHYCICRTVGDGLKIVAVVWSHFEIVLHFEAVPRLPCSGCGLRAVPC